MEQVSPPQVQTDPFSGEVGRLLVLCFFSCVPPFCSIKRNSDGKSLLPDGVMDTGVDLCSD